MNTKITNLFKVLLFSLVTFSWVGSNAQTVIAEIGTGTSTTGTSTASPINIWYRSSHHQIIYPASELIAAGMTGGARLIDSIAWDVIGAPIYNLPNYTIKIKNTSATTATIYDAAGLTTVHTGTSYAPVAGSYDDFLEFSTPFLWDGSSNILIDVCWDLVTNYDPSGTLRYTTTTNAVKYIWSDGSSQCGVTTTNISDYRPNVKIASRPAPVCTSVSPGSIIGPSSVCPDINFTLTADGATTGYSGITYSWEYSTTSATGPWSPVAGSWGTSYSPASGISTPTWFRMGISCSGGTTSYTSSHYVGINPPSSCYCTPTTYYTTYYMDTFRTFGGITNIDNSGSGAAPASYEFFTDDTLTVIQGENFDVYGRFGPYTWLSMGAKVWIDYNQDGDFGDAGEVAYSTSSYVTSLEGTILVPTTADTGITRMRVGLDNWSGEGPYDPCTTTIYYGEFEDYVINIRPMPLCSDPEVDYPASTAAYSNIEAICVEGDIILNITNPMPVASGLTYQWQSSTSSTGPWTNIGTPLTTPQKELFDVSDDLYYRVIILCEGSNLMTSENVFVEAVVPTMPTVYGGQTCGPGTVDLSGTVASGTIYWYDTAVGGVPIGSGSPFTTPALSTTTTFYAAAGASPPAQAQVGAGTSSGYYWSEGPFQQYYPKTTMQYLYTASEIEDSGGTPGLIDAIKFYCSTLPSTDLENYTISMKLVPASMTSLVWQTTGMTEVYGGVGTTFSPPAATGWVTFPLSTPFVWDGVSHIVVQICKEYTGTTYGGTGANRYTYDGTGTKGKYYYDWSGSGDLDCNDPSYKYESYYIPNIIFNFPGCMSERDSVIAYVRDTPTVTIPIEDGTYCMINHTFDIPSAPAQPDTNTYMWSTGSTDSFVTITTPGVQTHWVTVTTEYGCIASDTVHLTLNPSPDVDLGADTSTCEGGNITLDPHDTDGVAWYWNTGETTPTIVVDNDGYYSVLVTNGFGCMTTDTVYVEFDGFFPIMDGISVDNLAPMTFKFTPFNPEFITSYLWDFGDGTTSLAYSPTHTYTAPGTYLVTCSVTSTCGTAVFETFTTVFTGIEDVQLADKHLMLYPNPAQNIINLEAHTGFEMNRISIINVLGQEVKKEEVDNATKHSLDISNLPSGSYNVKIDSKGGTMIRKFQIIR